MRCGDITAVNITVGQQMTEAVKPQAVKPQVMERQTSGVKLGPKKPYSQAQGYFCASL